MDGGAQDVGRGGDGGGNAVGQLPRLASCLWHVACRLRRLLD